MSRRKLSFTTRYVLAFGLLMLFANAILGIVILLQSEVTVKSLINKNMLDVVKSAAQLLDGDALGALTEADVDGEVFRNIEERLIVFQSHEDIRYIYAVKQVDENKFVFTVDPDPVDPGAFGEETVVTDALIQAARGTPSVDGITVEDRWGDFYSAYCPVFDSSGKVAGVVGIDFDAAWYDAKIRQHTIAIAIITAASVLIAGLVVFLITYNVRKRFRHLDTELTRLSSGMDLLIAGAVGTSAGNTGSTAAGDTAASTDEIEKLALKIHTIQNSLNAYEQLQKDRYYNDAPTGIPNLNFIRQFADDRVNMLRAANETPAVLYFDVRSMVSYNTQYGYSRGDELLRLTAQTIRNAFPDALVGRGEGDHFIVVDAYRDGIEQKVPEINETIKKEAYGRTTGIQCAIVILEPGMKPVEGIQRARSTLKTIGDDLNVVCRLYSSEEDNDFRMSQYIVQHFDEAMRNGWIKVFYQPILRTETRAISILEALARWVDPEMGVISPGRFIPVLSRYHQLHKLDLYMVDRICSEYGARKEGGLPDVPVSVNFSAQDFDYINVADALNRALEKHGVSRSSIIVEITEQDLAQASDSFKEQLQRIHESGYLLWLDDFGSGYSSLNVFGQYHIDRIKFDMELVRRLDDNNGANRIIMKTITDMCRQMGIHTLSEGVETEEQYRFLCDIGCEMVQGFYFFRPDPLDKLTARIHQNDM